MTFPPLNLQPGRCDFCHCCVFSYIVSCIVVSIFYFLISCALFLVFSTFFGIWCYFQVNLFNLNLHLKKMSLCILAQIAQKSEVWARNVTRPNVPSVISLIWPQVIFDLHFGFAGAFSVFGEIPMGPINLDEQLHLIFYPVFIICEIEDFHKKLVILFVYLFAHYRTIVSVFFSSSTYR